MNEKNEKRFVYNHSNIALVCTLEQIAAKMNYVLSWNELFWF